MRRGSGVRGSERGGRREQRERGRKERKNQHHAIAPLPLSRSALLSSAAAGSERAKKKKRKALSPGSSPALIQLLRRAGPGAPLQSMREAERAERGQEQAAKTAKASREQRVHGIEKKEEKNRQKKGKSLSSLLLLSHLGREEFCAGGEVCAQLEEGEACSETDTREEVTSPNAEKGHERV